MGRIILPFRTIFKEEMKDLKSFRDALTDPSRRDAFGSLKRAWSSEKEFERKRRKRDPGALTLREARERLDRER